jgi:hypothetical protein
MLKRPSGWEEKITPIFRGSDVILDIQDHKEIGNHRIEQAQRPLYLYSVNHSPRESIQEFYSEDDITDMIVGANWISDPENLNTEIELSRFGKELWPYILAFVLGLFIIELILGYTTSRHQKNLFEQVSGVASPAAIET